MLYGLHRLYVHTG